ncbi:hypothetical protein BOTBODRAFT_439160 [Botryobasidium botryosum FD-172 SS1]|uniref:Uncharacterized protein n=1 Tax=Botryobasidium botryosum (strain FD-172 SS1) TaxID=930990 RepID=A0A067N6N5_BOTB1|nr:hypothetical protein BOTBODRAFT_439160 [Botryobasidium botryosum FD-172 SS1]
MRRAHTPALGRHLNSIVVTMALHLAIHSFQSPRGSSFLIFLFHLSLTLHRDDPLPTGRATETARLAMHLQLCATFQDSLQAIASVTSALAIHSLRSYSGPSPPHLSPLCFLLLCFLSSRRPLTSRTRAREHVGYARLPTFGRLFINPPSPPRPST